MAIRLFLAAGLLLGARPQSEAPDADTVAAVRAALEAGREAAAARVREAREAVGAESREEEARDGRFERALKEVTTRSPLRLVLTENVTLQDVRVTSYVAGRVTLTWPQGEVEYPLELLPDEARGAMVGAALSKGTARDHFEMGKLLVRGKDFDRAARCFSTAARMDPALAPFVPDLERVKRAARLFEGSFKATGHHLSLRWGFSSLAEGDDFAAMQGKFAVRPGQGLEIEGSPVGLAAAKEIPFRNRIRLSALARETDAAAHLMGIRFVKPDGGEVLIYGALATSVKAFLVKRVEDGKTQELLAPTAGATGNRMTMDFNRGRFVFQVGERTVWSGNEGGFTDVQVLVGSLAPPSPKPRAAAQFKEVSLQGEVNPQWMAKKTAGLRDAFASELSKEHRARRGDSAGNLALSVDAAIARAPAMIQDGYKAALTKIATMRQTQLRDDLVVAQAAMDQVAAADPGFAPAWYWRGVLAETSGDPRAASEHHERALVLLPDFPEALCGRARLRSLAGKWDQVREAVDRALALKPDLAEAHLIRARLHWEAREAPAVIETTRIARRLAPGDPELQSESQMLANVARGPRWSRPNAHTTANYEVRSDLAAAKCRLYAEHLEAMRPHYQEVLGRALPAGKPAEVLIFESEEGYFIYNDFTVGSRQEHSLGAFSPWHGQLALFEGVEPDETLKVLAHEGFHQYLHALAPDVPIWFNEGMAEYVGAAKVEKGRIVERGGIQTGRLDNLKLAVKYGWQPLPFDKIMLESQSEFYGPQAPFKYAQAWSMVRFFLEGEAGRWKPVFKEYTDNLLQGQSARSAFDATFAKQDLKALEAAWLKHYGLVVAPKKVPAARPPAPEPEPPVDLMTFIAGRKWPIGGWVLADGRLQNSIRPGAGLDLGFEPPAEYDWRLTVQRLWGSSFLALGLQGQGSAFVVKIDDEGFAGIDALDGKARNETWVRMRPIALPMKVSVLCSVRKTGVSLSINGSVVLDWKGDLGRLTYLRGQGMPAPTRSLFLAAGREDHFVITEMTVTTAASEPTPAPGKLPLPRIAVDPARSIPVGCDLNRWIVDEDHRQILALDPAGQFLQISMTDMKVVKKVSIGANPTALCVVPGTSKTAWAAADGGRSLVKIDLQKGEATDSIPVKFPVGTLVAFRKYVYYSPDGGSGIWGVDTSDKKDLGQLQGNPSAFEIRSISYESRKDRIWGVVGGGVVEFEASKLGATMRELTRSNLGGGERGELVRGLTALVKMHPVSLPASAPKGLHLLLDEKNARIFLMNAAAKLDRPETVLGAFSAPVHSLDQETAVSVYSLRARAKDRILAASPDGKWVASGTHIFNAATFAPHKEIPLPTSLAAFSKDSKELCYFDWVNQVVAVIPVEGK